MLARTAAGNITLFAFDAGEELSEHTAPFDALVLTLSGSLVLTIGGREVRTTPQSLVLMPAHVPHAVGRPNVSDVAGDVARPRSERRIKGDGAAATASSASPARRPRFSGRSEGGGERSWTHAP